MTAPEPAPAASRDATSLQQPDERPSTPSTLAQAVADFAIAELNTRRGPASEPIRPHGPTWTRIAALTYRLLRQHEQAQHPDRADPPPRCQADPLRIRQWLERPCGMAGFDTDTNAEYWDLHDFDPDSGAHVETLVAEAQTGGVFGVPGHQILAWYVPGQDSDQDGFLVTVDTPSGHRHCSSWLPYHTVMHDRYTGAGAVIHTLASLTTAVDEALTGKPGRPNQPDTTAAAHTLAPPPAAKAFPPPSGTAEPTPPPPAPAPPGDPRTTGPHR